MYGIKDVCMLVVFYNGNNDTVNRIIELSEKISRIVVVDNGSQNSNILEKLSTYENILVIYNRINRGIAKALNQGLRFANDNGYPLLISMDQDSRINVDTIDKLARAIDISNCVVSVGPFFDGKIHNSDQCVTNLITSGNIVHVESIIKVGGFKEELFIDCVDIDISFNLIVNGYVMRKIAGTYMIHKIGEYEYSKILRVKYLSHNPKRYFYKIRNNIYIYRNYGKKLPKLCLKLGCVCTLEMLKVIFLECNKKEKLKYIFEGIRQGIGISEWNNRII